MTTESRSRLKSFRTSLRTQVALLIALPLFIALSSLSLIHYWREGQLLEDQIQLTALQLGEMLTGSLYHSMLNNDFVMIAQTLADMGTMENVERVQIVGLDGRVKVDSHGDQVGQVWRFDDLGCKECHQFPNESRPRTMRLSTLTGVLRISTPIENGSDCAKCHTEGGPHLGVLLADMSIVDIEGRLFAALQIDLVVSVGITVLVTAGVYLLIHWLVVRRVEAFRRPLAKFATGDFTSRLSLPAGPADELGELANAVNLMMGELEHQSHLQEEHEKLQQRAIAEERGRIARELHDGLAQLLGYVNTKATTVRQALQNQQVEEANRHLLQLEKAARALHVDLREAILGLKMAEQDHPDLTDMLQDLATQFSRLSDLPIEVAFSPAAEGLSLGGEIELQLFRIVQESLTNIRKHAAATRVWLSVRVDEGVLELTVSDDGRGFDPTRNPGDRRLRFGLSTMRERVEAIGAEFSLDSRPGAGTRIMVCLPLENLPQTRSEEN